MAREILRGHLFAFYWGQYYGGAEAYVVAALFALFGQSRFVLGLAPMLLDAVATLLVWRLGRRLFNGRVGVVAALIFWIWPENYLYQSTVEYGFRYLALVCGLALVLFSLRVVDPRRAAGLLDWAALGFFFGVGWWCSPEIVYFALPAGALLVFGVVRRRLRPARAAVVACVAAAVVGALPWLLANASQGFPSLHGDTSPLTAAAWASHAHVFFQYVLPMVLGLRLRATGVWLVPRPVGPALYILLVALAVAWMATLVARRQARVLVAFVAVFPILYALWPSSSYWADGRYALYLAAPLCLLLAAALFAIASLRPSRLFKAVPVLGVVAALALTAGAVMRVAPYTPLAIAGAPRPGWTVWRSDPDTWLQPLILALANSHERYVYTGYWISYTLAFEARGAVVASDPGDYRYTPYLLSIARSPNPAWVFPRPSATQALDAAAGPHPWLMGRAWTLTEFESYLDDRHVRYRAQDAGFFTIVYPARKLPSDTVLSLPPA